MQTQRRREQLSWGYLRDRVVGAGPTIASARGTGNPRWTLTGTLTAEGVRLEDLVHRRFGAERAPIEMKGLDVPGPGLEARMPRQVCVQRLAGIASKAGQGQVWGEPALLRLRILAQHAVDGGLQRAQRLLRRHPGPQHVGRPPLGGKDAHASAGQ